MSVGVNTLTIPFAPDWASGVKVTYKYETALFENKRHNEQRRALQSASRRIIETTFNLTNTDASRLNFLLVRGKDQPFAVPLYTEVMVPSAIGGAVAAPDSITVPDCSDLWNLNNRATYLFLADYANDETELLVIDSIFPTSILVTTLISGSFTVNSTYAYPIFWGFLAKEPELKHRTSQHLSIGLTFEEFIDGG